MIHGQEAREEVLRHNLVKQGVYGAVDFVKGKSQIYKPILIKQRNQYIKNLIDRYSMYVIFRWCVTIKTKSIKLKQIISQIGKNSLNPIYTILKNWILMNIM